MLIHLHSQFKEDIQRLRKENIKLIFKVWELIFDTEKTPFSGIGKPEALKGNLSGFWSRRIDQEHRLIYKVDDEILELISCYGHYDS
jgi:toxin YoeB